MRHIGDHRIIRALGHPLRAQILSALDAGEASPKELARALGEKLGNVSYHVRILAELELIELVRRTPVRGAVEHHYRALPRPGAVVNVQLGLDPVGWAAATEAVSAFTSALAEIAARHPGQEGGRVVAAVLQPAP